MLNMKKGSELAKEIVKKHLKEQKKKGEYEVHIAILANEEKQKKLMA